MIIASSQVTPYLLLLNVTLAHLCLCSGCPVVGRPGLSNICDSTHQGVPKLISRAQYKAGGREAGWER